MLTIENLSHVYGNGTRALDTVNLFIPAGMFGLLGPNGAGKSTLMRTIATLQSPTAGSIVLRWAGRGQAEPEALRRTLGYLPQDFGVYPRVSAYDMLDHMAVLKGIGSRRRPQADRRGAAPPGQSLGPCGRRRWRVSPAACASASASPRR